jgi:hypothetical protein
MDQGKRIHYLIGVNGAVAAQEMIRNAAGGVDYIAQRASGKHIGPAAILGINIDGDPYADDLIRNGLAFVGDAKREIAAIPIPVTWFLGRHDAWIDPATIREFMAVPATAPRELIELDIGHLPLTSFEAFTLFSQIVRCIGKHVLHEELEPAIPDPRELLRVRHAEWRRVPKSPLPDRRSYWQEYLLGNAEYKVGYDVLNASDDYLAFLDREAELLDLRPEHVVADMGCGTGNFAARLLRRRGHKTRPICARLALVDFVPEALDNAERKLHALAHERDISPSPPSRASSSTSTSARSAPCAASSPASCSATTPSRASSAASATTRSTPGAPTKTGASTTSSAAASSTSKTSPTCAPTSPPTSRRSSSTPTASPAGCAAAGPSRTSPARAAIASTAARPCSPPTSSSVAWSSSPATPSSASPSPTPASTASTAAWSSATSATRSSCCASSTACSAPAAASSSPRCCPTPT